jgi:glycosyltransferase involved in cell wall biosynthesis
MSKISLTGDLMVPDVSIVIRAYNEAGPLRRLLEWTRRQEFEGAVEVIVVDNGSTDGTAAVAREFGARVVTLPQGEFSYPKSLNLGVEAARAPVVVCLVAHAYPDTTDWLARGLRHFADRRVAGVYSYTKAHAGAPLWDWLVHGPGYVWSRWRGPVAMRHVWPGTFGATNLALRRALWEERDFDERYGAGGEDSAWAAWAMARGYKIIRDPAFVVRHSHYLQSWGQVWRQIVVWLKTGKPRRFDQAELTFREKM